MPASPQSPATLLSLLALSRRLLGRKMYVLVVLLPLSTISDAVGIALLLPLLAALDGGQALSGADGNLVGKMLGWLPLPHSPLPLLALVALAFVMKGALRFVTDVVRGFYQADLRLRLKLELLQAYTTLDYKAFSHRNTGHHVNIVNGQTGRLGQAFNVASQLLVQSAAGIVYLVTAALINWTFALIACLAGLAFMLGLRTLTSYVRELSRQTAAESSQLNKHLVQILQAMKYLKATHRTGELSQRIHHSCQKLFRLQIRDNLARSFTGSLQEPLSVLLVLGLVAVQLYFFSQPLGSVFIALLLLHRSTQALFSIQGSWQSVMSCMGSAEMIQQELEYCSNHQEVRGPRLAPQFQSSVDFHDVSFAYDKSDGEVLRSVNLRIPRNQTIALVGHSGAGKSTLADLLTLLLRPTRGRVLIDGHDVSDVDPGSWRRQLGYVCQETVIFDETIAANICLSESAHASDPECQRRVREAARQAFVSSFIESLPEGYETIVGDRGVRLSGGQRQRLFIARELYKRPQLLILDEATSALDGESEKAIQESIDALRGQMTVVVIAHRLATIKNADYIYVLEQGRVIEHGPYEQLHGDADSRFRRMVELQSL